jgi:hypothetical protein
VRLCFVSQSQVATQLTFYGSATLLRFTDFSQPRSDHEAEKVRTPISAVAKMSCLFLGHIPFHISFMFIGCIQQLSYYFPCALLRMLFCLYRWQLTVSVFRKWTRQISFTTKPWLLQAGTPFHLIFPNNRGVMQRQIAFFLSDLL